MNNVSKQVVILDGDGTQCPFVWILFQQLFLDKDIFQFFLHNFIWRLIVGDLENGGKAAAEHVGRLYKVS